MNCKKCRDMIQCFYTEENKMRIPENSFLRRLPVAHRGLHGQFPENSMPAFRAAAEAGYAIETDVRLSADGVPVLIHDADTLRMTGTAGKVSDLTLKQLQALRLGGSAEHIPALAELVPLLAATGTPLLLELKDVAPRRELAEKSLALLEGSGIEFAVQSFDPRILLRVKKLAPHILRGQLGCFYEKFTPKWYVVKHMCLNFLTKPDFISYRVGDLPFGRARRKDTLLLCWTVCDEDGLGRAERYADNFIFENIRPLRPEK